MKKILNLLRYVPKRFVPVLALALAAAIPAVILAWGPSRTTFTMENPAPYVTFNSITNNPEYGDERSFLTVRDLTTGQTLGGSTTVVPGHEYLFQVYVHNNAASNLNNAANNYKGIAHDTTVEAAIPSEVNGSADAAAYVRASNATPGEVWDTVQLSSTGKVSLDYQEGSAKFYNNHFTSGTPLSDSLMTASGAKVGYEALNGDWPGCLQYSGTVTFHVKAVAPTTTTYEVQKTVRINGAADTTFKKSVAAKPGDKVDYQIYYKNTGSATTTNVVIKDQLPAGMTYVAGSTWLHNSNGTRQVADGITTNGLNIGGYITGGDAYLKFTAQVAGNDALPTCGPNTLHNVASAQPEGQSPKQDSADVTTNKECQPPQAKYSCNALEVAQISRTQFSFQATSTVENADFVKYVYIVRDANGKEVTRLDGTHDQAVVYTQATVGKYSVEADLVVKVNGTEKTVTGDACKKSFEVKEQPVTPVYTCQSLQLIQQVSRDTFTFKVTPHTEGNTVSVKEYVFDFGDNQTKTVSVGNESQTHTYAQPGDYTVKASVTFTVDGKTVAGVTSDACKVNVNVKPVPPTECKPGIPVGDERCTPGTTTECKPGVPMGSPSCNEQPQTPQTPAVPGELPSTGPETIVGGLFGTSALGLGVHAWMNSRRALREASKR